MYVCTLSVGSAPSSHAVVTLWVVHYKGIALGSPVTGLSREQANSIDPAAAGASAACSAADVLRAQHVVRAAWCAKLAAPVSHCQVCMGHKVTLSHHCGFRACIAQQQRDMAATSHISRGCLTVHTWLPVPDGAWCAAQSWCHRGAAAPTACCDAATTGPDSGGAAIPSQRLVLPFWCLG